MERKNKPQGTKFLIANKLKIVRVNRLKIRMSLFMPLQEPPGDIVYISRRYSGYW
jgi:hypothetical protein